jgi:hypothetical protein
MTRNDRDLTTGEEQMLGAFMLRLQSAPLEDSPRMPGADVLRLKARLIRQWEAQRRIRRPIDLMEPFELAASAAAAALLLLWSLPSAFDWLPRLTF